MAYPNPIERWRLTYTDSQGEQEETLGGPKKSAMRAARAIKADTQSLVRIWRSTPAGWMLDDKV